MSFRMETLIALVTITIINNIIETENRLLLLLFHLMATSKINHILFLIIIKQVLNESNAVLDLHMGFLIDL